MITQQDHIERVVALVNLNAMCEDTWGDFYISQVSRSRVHVFHRDTRITAILPCYPSPWPDDTKPVAYIPSANYGTYPNVRVVLDPLRYLGDWTEAGSQIFDQLFDRYACRVARTDLPAVPDEWRVMPVSKSSTSREWLLATHSAYHEVWGGAEDCPTCKSPAPQPVPQSER